MVSWGCVLRRQKRLTELNQGQQDVSYDYQISREGIGLLANSVGVTTVNFAADILEALRNLIGLCRFEEDVEVVAAGADVECKVPYEHVGEPSYEQSFFDNCADAFCPRSGFSDGRNCRFCTHKPSTLIINPEV